MKDAKQFRVASVPGNINLLVPILRHFAAKRKIVGVTAWDFPSGLVAETAGIDLVLVGDSLGITFLGYKDTKAVTLNEMVHHTRAVTQAVKTGFVLADLPLGSYEKSTEHAIDSAIRLVKEGGAHGVKLEGGSEMSPTIQAISRIGIPVIRHIGLTLQRDLDASNQGDDSNDAVARILADANSVASQTAAKIINALRIPTIGIGSGPNCSGQLALQTEILGFQTSLLPE
ncbi:3-methyl-2-oxobutanoate hydroxymethyltransferase [Thelonectria olida]|uniref:3-methyl-2-oxobutanoate hydroxymethyltransferase n=1 Tax=Thelonectria olida TaxID=1576542 RepID=A0A9P9AKU0_9HYPO|nr:3-methyl-2-oxobutanoate hydroxymethyltransferase [Thelonectria olida]